MPLAAGNEFVLALPGDDDASQSAGVGSRPSSDDSGRSTAVLVSDWIRRPVFWLAVLNIVTIVLAGALSPGHTFWDLANLQSLALTAAESILLACGVALLIGARQFDLSLGPNLILASVVAGQLIVGLSGGQTAEVAGTGRTLPVAYAVAVPAAVGASALIGALNGLVVVRFRVNALIATLGTLGVADGIALLLCNGADVTNVPQSLQRDFGVARIAGTPNEFVIALVATIALWFVLARTSFGTWILAIGSNSEGSRRSGVRVGKYVFALFTLAGTLAGVAGILDLAQFGSTNVAGHQTDALLAASAAVIGGGTLNGGRASIWGAALGAIWIVMVESALVSVGVSAYYQFVLIGVALIAAVAIDETKRRREVTSR